jgi:hypothetical protein
MMVGVVEGLRSWSFGEVQWSGGQIISSILLRSVVRLVRLCARALMGLACVILGCFVAIKRLAGLNLGRSDWNFGSVLTFKCFFRNFYCYFELHGWNVGLIDGQEWILFLHGIWFWKQMIKRCCDHALSNPGLIIDLIQWTDLDIELIN